MGTSPFGNLFRETTDEDTTAAVDAAWDGGVRYFDTAPHYGLGLGEKRLGAGLRDRPRDEYVISTKVGRLLVPTPENAGQLDDDGFVVPAEYRRQWDFSRDGILRSVEESLERLGLDRVDVLYLHDPDEHWEAASTTGISTLIELRDQGVVKAIGAGMNQSAMLARFVAECDVDLMMLAGRYTLLEQRGADEVFDAAGERSIVAVGVFNSGLLSTPRPKPNAMYNYQPAPAELIDRANRLADTAEAHGATLPQAAIAFPLRHPQVASIAIGMRNPGQVASNVALYESGVDESAWAELAPS